MNDTAAAVRRAGDERGLSTGAVGEWMGSHNTMIQTAVAVAAGAVLLVVRPLTASVIIWTAVVAVLVLLVVLLVSRPTPHTPPPQRRVASPIT
jgi:hypothetical protein